MTPEQAILHAYRPHDRHVESQLAGLGLTAMQIVQAFYGVEGGREFLVNFLAEHARPAEVGAPVEQQTWERPLTGTDAAELRMLLEVDGQGRAYVHEALLGRLLLDAGWERTR